MAGALSSAAFKALTPAQLETGVDDEAVIDEDEQSDEEEYDRRLAAEEVAANERLAAARAAAADAGQAYAVAKARRVRRRRGSAPDLGAAPALPPGMHPMHFALMQLLAGGGSRGRLYSSGGGRGRRRQRRHSSDEDGSDDSMDEGSDGSDSRDGRRSRSRSRRSRKDGRVDDKRRRTERRKGKGASSAAPGVGPGGVLVASKRARLDALAEPAEPKEATGNGEDLKSIASLLGLPKGSMAILKSLAHGGEAADKAAAKAVFLRFLGGTSVAPSMPPLEGTDSSRKKKKKAHAKPRTEGGASATPGPEGGDSETDEERPRVRSAEDRAKEAKKREEEQERRQEFIADNKDKHLKLTEAAETALAAYERAVKESNRKLIKAQKSKAAAAATASPAGAVPGEADAGAGAGAANAQAPPPPPAVAEEDDASVIEVEDEEAMGAGLEVTASPGGPGPADAKADATFIIPPGSRVGPRFKRAPNEYACELEGMLGAADIAVRECQKDKRRPGAYLARLMAIKGLPSTAQTMQTTLKRAAAQVVANTEKARLMRAIADVRTAVAARLAEVPAQKMSDDAFAKARRTSAVHSIDVDEAPAASQGGGSPAPKPKKAPVTALGQLLEKGWYELGPAVKAALHTASEAHDTWLSKEGEWRSLVGTKHAKTSKLRDAETVVLKDKEKQDAHRERWLMPALLTCWPCEPEGEGGEPAPALPEPELVSLTGPAPPLPSVLTFEAVPAVKPATLKNAITLEKRRLDKVAKQQAAAAAGGTAVVAGVSPDSHALVGLTAPAAGTDQRTLGPTKNFVMKFQLGPSGPMRREPPPEAEAAAAPRSGVRQPLLPAHVLELKAAAAVAGAGAGAGAGVAPSPSHPAAYTRANVAEAFDPLPAPIAAWTRDMFSADADAPGSPAAGRRTGQRSSPGRGVIYIDG